MPMLVDGYGVCKVVTTILFNGCYTTPDGYTLHSSMGLPVVSYDLIVIKFMG